jgi:hypothetical protein
MARVFSGRGKQVARFRVTLPYFDRPSPADSSLHDATQPIPGASMFFKGTLIWCKRAVGEKSSIEGVM